MTLNDSRSGRSIESLPKFLTTTRTRFEYEGSELVEKKASWFHLHYQIHKEIHPMSHRSSITETSSNQFQIPHHQRLSRTTFSTAGNKLSTAELKLEYCVPSSKIYTLAAGHPRSGVPGASGRRAMTIYHINSMQTLVLSVLVLQSMTWIYFR